MIAKKDLEVGQTVSIEVTSMGSFETDVYEVTIDWIDQMFDEPLEITAKDENGNNFRAYLDKNKLECTNYKNGNFIGCIGTIVDIYEQ